MILIKNQFYWREEADRTATDRIIWSIVESRSKEQNILTMEYEQKKIEA